MRIGFVLVGFLLFMKQTYAQVSAAFSLPSTACLNQTLTPINNSSNATQYFWDFDQGDLLLTPTAQNTGGVGGNVTTGLDVVFDGINWYGFVTSRDNTLIRLEYGPSLNGTPTRTVLSGFLSGVTPVDIKIIYAGGAWYGFVYGLDKLLVRVDFGASLTNTSPSTEVVINEAGVGDGGIDVVADAGNYYVAYSKGSGVGIAKLNSITSIPTPAEKTFTTIGSGALVLGDIKLVKNSNQWFGFVPSYFGTKQVVKLEFGNNPLNSPTEAALAVSALGSLTPYGVDVVIDNGNYIMFLCTVEGSIVRTNLGVDLTASPIGSTNLGNFSNVVSNTLKLMLPKHGSSWFMFSVSWATGALFRLTFPDPVSVAIPTTSTAADPNVIFTSPGNHQVSLVARNGADAQETGSLVTIENKNAPTVNFTSSGMCTSHDIAFASQVAEPITVYAWSFGDGDNSSLENPNHQYILADDYQVTLDVTASNGCSNKISKSLTVFNTPVANFILPASSVTCTNQAYAFTNTSGYDPASNPTWQWQIDNVNQATTQDGVFAFPAASTYEVKLTASIPGCSSSLTQNFNVQSVGPTVDFTMAGICQNDPVEFASSITGQFNSLQWNFGDGATSTLEDPSHNYVAIGNYDVQLTAINAAGCQNSTTKSLTIRSKPQPDFSLALPPFSCAGSASQFTDLTASMPDSNVNGWAWTFGDAAQGTSTIKNATYSYHQAGDYLVALAVTTNFGCTASIEKIVTISPSPTAAFTNAAACMSQGTLFTDVSGTDIKAWLWTMQSSTYTTKNPTHIFSATGQHPVTLAVTANNNCVSQIEKSITVPVPVSINFMATSTCATLPTTFTETTVSGSDPAVAWSWDFSGTTGNGSPIQHTFTNVGTYPVKLSSTRQSGCTYSVTKSIAIIQPPVASFTVPFTSGPAPLTVGFTNTSTQASSYLWKFNDSDNSTSTAFSPSFVFEELGSYPVELVASNAAGCSDSFVTDIQVVVPNMNAAITDFVLSPNPDGTWRGIVTIENRSNMAITNPEVYLDLAGRTQIKERVTATLQPNQIYTQQISTDFIGSNLSYVCAEVRLPNDVYAFDDSQCATLTNESIALAPYPNPASDELNLNWINQGDEQLRITIFNSGGQIVMDQEYSPLLQDLNQVRVDVSGLKPGIYYVSFKSGTRQSKHRFAVVR